MGDGKKSTIADSYERRVRKGMGGGEFTGVSGHMRSSASV
jgi:hypothetical protein